MTITVANAWVGTTVPQSSLLAKVIRDVIETGKTVTLAMKHQVRPSPGEGTETRSDEGYATLDDLKARF